jgi:hypothetical protein
MARLGGGSEVTDDEFLNDRDCTPKGETPRTDAATRRIDYVGAPTLFYVHADFARKLERELTDTLRASKEGWRYADELEQERKRLTEELARALRVVEAARRHAVNGDSGANLFWHVSEWEAGR